MTNEELIQDTYNGIIEQFRVNVVMWSGGVQVEETNLKICALIVVDQVIAALQSANSVESRILAMHYQSVKQYINARLQ